MLNLKKVLIVILVLFLILIVKKRNVLEKFFYTEKTLIQDSIYIEFFYKETCAKSRQFLHGCGTPTNNAGEKNTEKYREDNSCMPEDYFTPTTHYAQKKNLNGLSGPTKSKLISFLGYYISQNADEWKPDYLDEINYNDNKAKDITLFPLLRLKYKITGETEDTKHDYMGDVNDLCNIVNFLDDKTKEFGLELKEKFETWKNSPSPSQSSTFTCAPILATPYNLDQKYRDEDIEERNSLTNIKTHSYLFKRPRIHFSNVPTDTDSFMVIIQDKDLTEQYGKTTDKNLIYWMMWNIPSYTSYLEEKLYDKIDNITSNDGTQKFFELFPYQLFDPEKYPQFINRKCTDNLENTFIENFTTSNKIYTSTPSPSYTYIPENRIENSLKNKQIDRQLELEIIVIPLDETERKTLNEEYFKHRYSNISKFYELIFELHNTNTTNNKYKEMRLKEDNTIWEKEFYTLKYSLSDEQSTKLSDYQINLRNQTNIYEVDYHPILTATAGLQFKTTLSTNNQNIYFGKKSYWILKFDSSLSVLSAGNIIIGNQKIYSLFNQIDNKNTNTNTNACIYRIPKYCSDIDIDIDTSSNTDNVYYFQTTNPTISLDWGEMKTSTETLTKTQYGVKHENTVNTVNTKFYFFKCLQDKKSKETNPLTNPLTNWLINFSFTTTIKKIEINGTEIYSVGSGSGSNSNIQYITEKTKDLNFMIEMTKGEELFNGTITPYDATEFINDITTIVPSPTSSPTPSPTNIFKLPKKSNWLLQLKVDKEGDINFNNKLKKLQIMK